MPRKKRFDDLMEAISFAEAGETETARDLASQVFPEDPQARLREQVLVMSRGPGFSRRMIADSIAMAERLGHGIVAVSLSPALARLVARLGGARKRAGALPPEEFRARAAERGVPFVHAARSGDPEAVVAEVRSRYRRIAVLVIEPGLAPRKRFAAMNIPVCVLADR